MASQYAPETLYTYAPLSSPRVIRLLEVGNAYGPHASGREMVPVSVVEVDVDSPGWRWDAISYRWGPAPSSVAEYKKLYVRQTGHKPVNQVIFVRPDLYQCLLRITQAMHSLFCYVWVDAVCINQLDADEKSRQVQMIGKIFSKASRVVIGLGEHADNSEAAFSSWEKSGADLLPPELMAKQDPNADLPEDEQRYRATVLGHLLSREYWTRTWIVQEILLAREITVFCGGDKLAWESLVAPNTDRADDKIFHGVRFQGRKVATRFANNIDLEQLVNHVRDLNTLRVKFQNSKSPAQRRQVELHNHSLFELVWQFRDTNCEDPRDKVYALLSLEKPNPQQKPIQVDFQEHRRDLYVRVCESRLTADYKTNWQHAGNLLRSLSLCWGDIFEAKQTSPGQNQVGTLSQRLGEIRVELGGSGRRDSEALDGGNADGRSTILRKAKDSSEAYRMQVLAAILDAAEASPGAPTGSVDGAPTPQESCEMASAATERLQFPSPPKRLDQYEEREYLKGRLALALRVFGKYGFGEGAAGHITVRDPVSPHQFWVNPSGLAFSQIKRSDLILVDRDGRVIDGGSNRLLNTAEYMIHVAVHEARPDVMCTAHSHSIYGRAFCTLSQPLDTITRDSCAFYNDLALYDSFRGVTLAREDGRDIASALGSKKAALLQNRGLLTVGRSIEEAAFWFVSLDQCCHTQLMADAAALGRGARTVKIDDESAASTYNSIGTPNAGWFSALPMFAAAAEEGGIGYLQ